MRRAIRHDRTLAPKASAMSRTYSFRRLHVLTSEVMERGAPAAYEVSMQRKAVVALVILAAFTAYSLWVVAGYGYTGFLSLAAREPWGAQMLIDLVIACSFGLGWMFGDAKRRGITTWPFVIA